MDDERAAERPAAEGGRGRPEDAAAIAALTAEVARLKSEVARLREELRRARRDRHETPPHYL